jgi:hypothetical protein
MEKYCRKYRVFDGEDLTYFDKDEEEEPDLSTYLMMYKSCSDKKLHKFNLPLRYDIIY